MELVKIIEYCDKIVVVAVPLLMAIFPFGSNITFFLKSNRIDKVHSCSYPQDQSKKYIVSSSAKRGRSRFVLEYKMGL